MARKDRIVGHVLRVVDGDTLVLDVDDAYGNAYTYNDVERVRLRSLNAPEAGTQGAAAATARLRNRVQGRRVSVEVHARDVYGRVIGDLKVA